MARRPAVLFPSPWLITLIYFTTSALASNIPSNASSLIPSCAQECFASFIDTSYSSSGCGSSFQCLCSQVGAAGYTMGEGALQCIVAERSIGYCSEEEASEKVVYAAYSMCSDEPDAVEPTHTVITATLIIPTSGGVVTFPSVTSTTKRYTTAQSTLVTSTTATRSTMEPTAVSSSASKTTMTTTKTKTKTESSSLVVSSYSTLPTTLVMETSSQPSVSTTSSSRITSKKSTSTAQDSQTSAYDPMSSHVTLDPASSTSSAAGETSTGAAAGGTKDDGADDDDNGNGLSQKQVAGISIGVLAAAGLLIGAVVVARRMRKKRFSSAPSGFLPIRDTWGYKPDPADSAGGSSFNDKSARRSFNPFPQRPAPPAPTFGDDTLSPNTIGLAISPGNSRVTSQAHTQSSAPSRRMSRLLPAKPVLPVLPLNVPGNRSPERPQSEWPRVPEQLEPTRQTEAPQLPPLQIEPAASSPATTKPPPVVVPKLTIPEPNLPTASEVQAQRESTMTEFEEDGRNSSSPNGQVWRPPPTPVSKNVNTYYIADEYGNWKLGDPKHASRMSWSQYSTAPPPLPKDSIYGPSTSSSKTVGGSETVSSTSDEASKKTLAPAAQIIPERSVSVPPHKPQGPRVQPSPPPAMGPQTNVNIRRHSSKRYSGRNLTRFRNSASSECTTISDSSEGTIIDPSPTFDQSNNLSPVQESPHSGRGAIKVSQPTIPPRDPRRSSVPTLRALEEIDPNKRTATAPPVKQVVYYPPGQPSPTLGAPSQNPVGPGVAASHWVPKPPRKPVVNPGLERTGSPTMRMVDPSPSPEDQNQPPRQRPDPTSRAPPFYFAPPYPQPLNPRQSQRGHRYSNSNPQFPSTRPLPNPPYRPARPNPPPHRHSQEAHGHHWHPLRASQQQLPAHQYYRPSFGPGPGPGGENPSLLAKRVGSERAAQLSIPTEARRGPWERNPGAPPPMQRPVAPPRGIDDEDGPQPWVPTLTPTRRGRDLVLNVQ